MNTNPYFIQHFAADHGRQRLAEADQARLVKAATPRSPKSGRRLMVWSKRRSTQVRPATAG